MHMNMYKKTQQTNENNNKLKNKKTRDKKRKPQAD